MDYKYQPQEFYLSLSERAKGGGAPISYLARDKLFSGNQQISGNQYNPKSLIDLPLQFFLF